MEDFEYCVEICDRDWERFFAECEECNILPPSLAGVDDSGLSDLDDRGFILAQRDQEVHSAPSSLGCDRPLDGWPPPPMEGNLGQSCGIGGVTSVLSGSEEDIHLQSVNVFFERLKSLTEPNRTEVGNIKEVAQKEELSDSWQQSRSRSSSPTNYTELGTLTEGGETALCKITTHPESTTSSSDLIEHSKSQAAVSSEPSACSNSASETCKSTDTGLIFHHKPNMVENRVLAEAVSQTQEVEALKTYLTGEVVLRQKAGTWSDQIPSHESSPSATVKRRRRKKRHLSVEASGAEKVWEKQAAVRQSDSEEEGYETARTCSGDCFTTSQPHQFTFLSASSGFHDRKVETQHSNCGPFSDGQHQQWPMTLVQQKRGLLTKAAEDGFSDGMLLTSALSSDAHAVFNTCGKDCDETYSERYNKFQAQEPFGLDGESRSDVSVPETEAQPFYQQQNRNTGVLKQSNKTTMSTCGIEENLEYQTEAAAAAAKVRSDSLLSHAESCVAAMEGSQNDKLPADETLLTEGSGNPGRKANALHESESQLLESDSLLINQLNTKQGKIPQLSITHVPTPSGEAGHVSLTLEPSDQSLQTRCPSEGMHTSDAAKSLSRESFSETSVLSENESKAEPEETPQMLFKSSDGIDVPRSPESSQDSTQRSVTKDAACASKCESELRTKGSSKFEMSSFWREMEKLTLKDILGHPRVGKPILSTVLPPVQEAEEPQMTSGCIIQVDGGKSHSAENEAKSFLPRSVTWESDPVLGSQDGEEKIMSVPVTDTLKPAFMEMSPKSTRKISKTVSVHNLPALESESRGCPPKKDFLQTLVGEMEDVEISSDYRAQAQETDAAPSNSSYTESYSISLSDIYNYLFGGKQSVTSRSSKDGVPSFSHGGNSIPETYDHFFSEFDTESFFYPLITTEEKAKDKPVTIFSYSRSTYRNLNFPEACEYFCASSSSDESSVESDEEEHLGPVRVVSRHHRRTNSSHTSTDIYENFFTDEDLRENFFSLKSLSFRNIRFTTSKLKQQRSNSATLVPVKQTSRSGLRNGSILHVNVGQDLKGSDPLLQELYNKISAQSLQMSLSYEDFQATVTNPRLDVSLLPLRQSDMCLVCIAFASWVLKTTNPQVGDAWKAVLLANVSALSAIRYLRRYIKGKDDTSEERSAHDTGLQS